MTFQFQRDTKFAMLAFGGVYSELPDAEFQLADGTWVMPHLPPVSDFGQWREWIGSIRAGSLERANLVFLSQESSPNSMILDEVHSRLGQDLGQLFYFLHFRQGIECSDSNEPDLLSGSCGDGSPIIRQMTRLNPFHQSWGYTRAPITKEWIEEAFSLRTRMKSIRSTPSEFHRLFRGLNVLFSGLRETGQERLHQFVRSLEALILPNVGSTRSQFVHRCQTFATAKPETKLALEEAFDMRSDTEHLQDWNRAVQRYSVSEREKVCWQRVRQMEQLACFAYRRVLLDPNILNYYRTDDTLAKLWTLRDHEIRTIWGKPLDIASEPRDTKCNPWGRAIFPGD